MKIIKKVFEIIFWILISLIILVNFSSIVTTKILKYDYPKIFDCTYFVVMTGSMEPTIKQGDVVIVKITKDIEKDDIITYKESNNYVTHRLIKKENNELITKGDYNNKEDDPINIEDVLGKVIIVIPFLGIILNSITNIYFILTVIGIIIMIEIIKKIKEN